MAKHTRHGAAVALLVLAALPMAVRTAVSQEPLDPARVAEISQWLPEAPCGVGRPADDRQAWEALAASAAFHGVVAQAEKLLGEPIPELTDDLYLDYSRTGNRTRGQKVIFGRRERFAVLVLAECLENRGRFLPAIEETVAALCGEKTWVLPAHDGGLENFHGKTVQIDLVAAATSWNLATADYWLGPKLRPETRAKIRSELERRTFTPYEEMLRSGKPSMWWLTGTNNWNAVCLAGVTGAATAGIEPRDRRARFVAAAQQYVQYFLSGFTPDGYCSEGLGYWNYGFGHYVLLSETICQATGGRLDLMADPRVRHIAAFGRRIEILPGVCPAFADCSVTAQPDTPLMAYLSRRFDWGLADVERSGLLAAVGPSRDLFDVGVYGFANSASRRPAAKESEPPPLRDWFADAGILICRPAATSASALGAALKGGHNAEHHNHNDVGSFVVALAGGTPLVDPGAEVYTARTFSGQRYTSGVLNSFGHPVPRVAGQLQRTGRSAQGRVVKTEFSDAADTLVLDLASAYPVKQLKKLQRTFTFSREGRGRLLVLDEVEFSEPQTFGAALVTFSKWQRLPDNSLEVGEGPQAVRVEIDTAGQKWELHPEEIREDLAGGRIPIRLGIDLAEPVTAAAVRISIAPK